MTDTLSSLVAALGGPARLAYAGAAVVAYLAFSALVLTRHRRRHQAASAAAVAAVPAEDADRATLLAFASQTGFAEELATRTADRLRASGHPAVLMSFDALDLPSLQRFHRALFVVSTTGEGDAPDSAERFCRTVMTADLSLGALAFGVLALGDRTYADYCAFGYAVDGWLRARGARPLFDAIDVDDGNGEAIERWQAAVDVACRLDPSDARWERPSFERWRLVERRLLNDGSPGGPAFHVALQPVNGTLVEWTAGDIAEVVPLAGADGAPPPDAVTREYSIASIPGDGHLELLVRQVRREDGTLGLGSGWLTAGAPAGGDIWIRVRRNAAFHPPGDDRPLLLVGNGTGLAGLRAHLKARAREGRGRNWLLFGERSPAHDRFHGHELDTWCAAGVLERCDLAYSRDAACPAYVQDLLRREAELVRRWVDDGAAIYVCGSRAGMAAGVDAALRAILGDEGLDEMRRQGRYRRDVY